MPVILVTADVFHDPMGWSKDVAKLNMWFMSVTADVFHDPMGWSKDAAR